MLEILSNDLFLANKNLSKLPKGISWNPSLFIHDNILLVFRGSNNKNKCLIYKNDAWKEHNTLNENRKHTSVVSTINVTFIIGGSSSANTFDFLPRNSNVWQKDRTNISGGFVSGRIVELSGKNDALLIGGDETKRHIL